MTNIEINADIIRFGHSLAVFNLDNLDTGFLTYIFENQMEKGKTMGLIQQSQRIVRELVKQLQASGLTPDNYQCGLLFQYIFDKVAEVTYKKIVGKKVDTTFQITEAFDYHEPDLPYYIQQKINNIVGKNAIIVKRTLNHIKENDYLTDNLEDWLLPFLLVPIALAIQFVLEMDFDDDSELRHFIRQFFGED